MLVTAIVLYCVVALGLLAMAAKFGLGPVPASHHAEAMSQDGVDVTPKLEMVLRGVYQAMAGAYLGLALLVVYLALVPIRAEQSEAALIVGLASLAVGGAGRVSGSATGDRRACVDALANGSDTQFGCRGGDYLGDTGLAESPRERILT